MRIALSFPGCHRRGGIERVVLQCANFLAARGHDVHLLASEWDAALLSPAVQCHHVPSRKFPALRMLSFAKNSAKAIDALTPPPDVHAAFGVQSPPGGVFWVPSVHKAWLETSQKFRPFSGRVKQRFNPFHAAALRLEHRYFAGRLYRRLIAHTTTVKNDLMRLYSVPESDIDVLPNGFAAGEFNLQNSLPHRQGLRHELGLGDDDKVILFVANELERKGFSPLLESIAAMKEPAVKLLVVGRVSDAAYRGRIEKLGLAARVQFIGPREDVARYYAAADLFVLPTQYESWGLVIVEALACGLPVVTSRLAGAACAVRENSSGFLLDDPRNSTEIAEKIRKALALPVDRQQISASVADLTWDAILPRYERILLDAAAK